MIYSIYIGGKLCLRSNVPLHKTKMAHREILDRMEQLAERGRVLVTVDSADNMENVTFILATRKASNDIRKLL